MTTAKSIVDDAFEAVAREAVRKVIAEHAGCGIDSDVKVAIREMASEIVKTDAEVRKMIRDRMVYWIKQQ